MVLVRKKDGGVRWCIDYRKLNDVTRKDSYPLPNIKECLDTLAGSTIFSTIDLQQGYHQIEVDQADKRKTALKPATGSSSTLACLLGCVEPREHFREQWSVFLKVCNGI